MTLEKESFNSDRDYTGKQRVFNRIVRRIEEQVLPGAPHVEQYFQNLHHKSSGVEHKSSGVESLSLTLPIFHEYFLLTPS